jgi:AraC-like DNA-binding protein
MDPLSPLFARFSLAAKVFFSGALCGEVDFDRQPDLGHLHLLRRGSLRITQQGSAPLDVRLPSLFFYPRPCAHAFHVDDPAGANLVCASIEFGASMGNPLLTALPDLLLVPLADIGAIEPTMALLFGEAFADLAGRQAAIDRLAEYALILLLRHVIDAGIVAGGLLAALADPRLSKALTAMHERPETPWTLESLARTAGMSRARFAAHFRDTAGATPLDYLTDWRISVAQTLLKRGKPLKLVAPLVGYSNPVALARVFARRIGVSPATWLARGSVQAPGHAERWTGRAGVAAGR